MKKTCINTLAFVAFFAAAISASAQTQLPGPTEPTLVSQAPSSWYGFSGGGITANKTYDTGYMAKAAPYAAERSVTIRYVAPREVGTSAVVDFEAGLANFVGSTLSSSGKVIEDSYLTTYWPTDFEWIEGTNFALVTGVSTTDATHTIFEVWVFESVVPKVTASISAGGTTVYSWVRPKRTNVRRILDVDLGLGGNVSFMIENKAKIQTWQFFMGIRGSNNIYHMDLLTGMTSIAASDVAVGGSALVAPHLNSGVWETCNGRMHEDAGIVYKVRPVEGPSYVYLFDGNQDGELDGWTTFSEANPSELYSFIDPKVTEEF